MEEVVLEFHSVTMIKHGSETTLARKGLFGLLLPGHSASKRKSGWELEAEAI